MRRLSLLLLLLSASMLAACDPSIVLEAQTFPINATLMWDAAPTSEMVTGYRVTVLGTVLATVPPTPISPCPDGRASSCVATAIVVSGPGTITVVALTDFAESDPATLTVGAKPSKPATLRAKKQ